MQDGKWKLTKGINVFCRPLLFVLVMALAMLSVFAVELNAAPVNGKEVFFSQPDGSRVPVRVWGDEFYQDVESLDGYTLVRGSGGWIYYAELSADGNEYVPTKTKYTTTSHAPAVPKGLRINDCSVMEKQHRSREESGYYDLIKSRQREMLSSGSNPASSELKKIVGLTILVNFQDVEIGFTKEEVEDFLNRRGGVGGETEGGSVYDYFYDISGGRMEYTNIVTPFVTVDKFKEDYENGPEGHTMINLLNDAINKLNEINFHVPNDVTVEDGTIRATNVLFAGDGVGGLRPVCTDALGSPKIGGLTVKYFQATDLGDDDNLPSTKTFLHETGHLLMGWPDLYMIGFKTDFVGSYCIMGSSDYAVRPNPYFLLQAGWFDTTHITNAPVGTKFSHTANSPYAYVFMRDTMDNP